MTPSPNPLPADKPLVAPPLPPGIEAVARAVGVDVVAVRRVEKSLQKFGPRYTQGLFTLAEAAYCQEQSGGRLEELANRLAARIAVKEAVAKALGCGLNGLGYGEGVPWNSIETLAEKDKPPAIQLHGAALARQQQVGVTRWLVSIAHDGGTAMAVVVGV